VWINLSSKELNLMQQGLDLLTKKIEGELKIDKAKLRAKIQQRMENDKRMQKEKEKLNKIFKEKAKRLENDNRRIKEKEQK